MNMSKSEIAYHMQAHLDALVRFRIGLHENHTNSGAIANKQIEKCSTEYREFLQRQIEITEILEPGVNATLKEKK